MKRFLSLIVFLSMLLSLLYSTSCSFMGEQGDLPADDNGGITDDDGEDSSDGEQSEPDAEDPSVLQLIKDKTALFKIVYDSSLDSTVKSEYGKALNKLRAIGISVSTQSGNLTVVEDCEVLVGSTFRNRPELDIDPYVYGGEGYVIRVVDDRVLIYGGSPEATAKAVKLFFETYIGIKDGVTDISDVSVPRSLLVEHKPQYDVSSFTIAGKQVDRSYVIEANGTAEQTAAELIRSRIYSDTGMWLDIVKQAEQGASRISIAYVADTCKEGFGVRADADGNLYLECSYINSFVKGTEKFLNEVLDTSSGNVSLPSDYVANILVSVVKYSEFGADTKGNTDAFEAIIATHAFANECGQRVEADEGAVYYIGHHEKTAIVKTDTDWKDAHFIIDDRNIPANERDYWIFKLIRDVSNYSLDLSTEEFDIDNFKRSSTNIGYTFDGPKMLVIKNDKKKVYIRYGANQNSGSGQSEIVIVDANGNISPDTPLIWDYEDVTGITVMSIADRPITIQGGSFTTRANQVTSKSNYYARGICIERSNVTVYNVKHYLTDQPDTVDGSCPYTGFFYANNTANTTFDSCVMTSHRTYKTTQADGDVVSQGNYDIQAKNSYNILWLNCTQSNDHNANKDEEGFELWGVMASNYCKNLKFDGCKLSRFDAHCGVHNISIVDSEIGKVINFVGSGTAYFENVTVSGGSRSYFLALRSDYGSTWQGDIVIRNCKLVSSKNSANLIQLSWNSWDFGYTCYIPNVDVDGFTIVNKSGATVPSTSVYVFNNFAKINPLNDSVNPYIAPTYIKTKNFYFKDYGASSVRTPVFALTTKQKL